MLIAVRMIVGRNEKDVLRTEKPLELVAEIVLLIRVPNEAVETAKRIEMVTGIRTVGVIGTAKGTEKRTGTEIGIETGIAREIENARERGTETETATVVTTRIATGKREKNAKLLTFVASRLLPFPLSLLMTAASLTALISRDTAIHPRTEMIILEKGDDRQTMIPTEALNGARAGKVIAKIEVGDLWIGKTRTANQIDGEKIARALIQRFEGLHRLKSTARRRLLKLPKYPQVLLPVQGLWGLLLVIRPGQRLNQRVDVTATVITSHLHNRVRAHPPVKWIAPASVLALA